MHLSLKAITLIPKSLIKYKDPDSVRPIKAELLSDSDRGVQTKRTLMTERQKVTGRSMQENFVGSLGLNGNSRMGSAYVRASGSCAGEWKEQVEGLAEEDSRERGWDWCACTRGRVRAGTGPGAAGTSCIAAGTLCMAARGTRMAAPSQHCARGGHGGQQEAGFQAASGCALA